MKTTDTNELRIRLGFYVIVAGFILIAVTLLIAVSLWAFRTSADQMKISDLVSMISTVTGVVGTIVGAFFGVNSAGAARDQMNVARQETQEVSNRALAHLSPEVAARVINP